MCVCAAVIVLGKAGGKNLVSAYGLVVGLELRCPGVLFAFRLFRGAVSCLPYLPCTLFGLL